MQKIQSNISKVNAIDIKVDNMSYRRQLSNPASAADILTGKCLLDDNYNIVYGTMPIPSEIDIIMGTVSYYDDTEEKIENIRNHAFAYCSSLTSVSFPSCITIGSNAFNKCTSLTSVNFPVCTSIGGSAFYSCSSLTSVNFPTCTSIGTSAFYGCSSLTSLTLGASNVCTLSNNVFTVTPMSKSTYTGNYGSIYVPASLVDAYKSATNWVTYSDRIGSITY